MAPAAGVTVLAKHAGMKRPDLLVHLDPLSQRLLDLFTQGAGRYFAGNRLPHCFPKLWVLAIRPPACAAVTMPVVAIDAVAVAVAVEPSETTPQRRRGLHQFGFGLASHGCCISWSSARRSSIIRRRLPMYTPRIGRRCGRSSSWSGILNAM